MRGKTYAVYLQNYVLFYTKYVLTRRRHLIQITLSSGLFFIFVFQLGEHSSPYDSFIDNLFLLCYIDVKKAGNCL